MNMKKVKSWTEFWQKKLVFNISIKTITLLSFLIALAIIANIFARFIVFLPLFGQIRISFTILILIVIGFIANPFLAFITGALVDVLSFFLGFTTGAFHLGFTLTSALIPCLASIFIRLFYWKNKHTNFMNLFWFISTLLIIFCVSILLLLVNPSFVDKWVTAIFICLFSIITMIILSLLILKKKENYITLMFLLFLLLSVSSFLNSVWLQQLLGLPYPIFLWPRLIKNFLLDWWIIIIVLMPMIIIIKKKKLFWWDK